MDQYSDNDPYLDRTSGVLKNKLGITDAEELEQAEASLAAARSYQLQETPIEGNFDLKHLQAMHKHLLGDVYEWAGELRTVDISKSSNMFARPGYIESAAEPIFRQLAKENHLAGLDRTTFSERAGHYLGELNALHPFREGNGRTQREFISGLARENGYYIAWENVKDVEMVQASIHAFHGDASRMSSLIEQNVQSLGAEYSTGFFQSLSDVAEQRGAAQDHDMDMDR